jgi:hypothetical protein
MEPRDNGLEHQADVRLERRDLTPKSRLQRPIPGVTV